MRALPARSAAWVFAFAVVVAIVPESSAYAEILRPTGDAAQPAVLEWLGAIPDSSGFPALVTGVFGLIGGFLSAFLKIRYDLRGEYDRDLRNRRLVSHKALWGKLQPLAMYAAPAPVTYQTVRDLSASLRRWYYLDGGLFLSSNRTVGGTIRYLLARRKYAESDATSRERRGAAGDEDTRRAPRRADYDGGSRQAYFAVQDALQEILRKAPHDGDELQRELDGEGLDALKNVASRLRTSLTEDIGTRRRAWLAGG